VRIPGSLRVSGTRRFWRGFRRAYGVRRVRWTDYVFFFLLRGVPVAIQSCLYPTRPEQQDATHRDQAGRK